MSSWALTFLDFGTSSSSFTPSGQQGSATLVPADGSAYPTGTAVTYAVAFPTQTNEITIGLSAYSGSDNASLGYNIVGSTKTGFHIVVTGGAPGSTVTVGYNAFGQ
ncbi:MAG: hypothetical protein KGL39_12975 [Patescibacteria group bacterium]|nr:hypothetical protein [Patescibacteria group bacterium]